MLTRALSVDPRIEVVGTAKTGVEAISQAQLLSPDVITLDIEMPELSGLEALPYIRKACDARILMLSTLDDPDTTYEALSLGAIDFIPKPRSGVASSLSELSDSLLKKIRTAYRIAPGVVHEQQRSVSESVLADASDGTIASSARAAAADIESLVAIAASTGGPPALERVFSGLSASLPASYLIVQHLPQGFSGSLARRLSAVGDVEVVEARADVPLRAGTAYLAPYGRHMIVEAVGGMPRIRFDDSPSMHGVRPSADPLFRSVSQAFGSRTVGVVLTGMGADGKDGMAMIRDAGGITIAQDEATSVVWGMPGSAAKSGAARHVVPIGLIAAEVRRAIRGGRAV